MIMISSPSHIRVPQVQCMCVCVYTHTYTLTHSLPEDHALVYEHLTHFVTNQYTFHQRCGHHSLETPRIQLASLQVKPTTFLSSRLAHTNMRIIVASHSTMILRTPDAKLWSLIHLDICLTSVALSRWNRTVSMLLGSTSMRMAKIIIESEVPSDETPGLMTRHHHDTNVLQFTQHHVF